jgi:L-asparaginase
VTGTRRIALIATGGTIDSLGTDRLDLAFYTETGRRLADGDLLRSLPEVAAIAEVEEVPYPRTPSYALTPDDWMALGALVQRTVDRGCDGVVITHGTNTLEETAFFLHLMVRSDKPVVLTGAMRPANGLGSDGALNLLRAISVAAAPSSAGLGCVVVMDGTIHAARDVTKTATFRLDAFQSPDAGPLGYVDADGTIVMPRRPPPHDPIGPWSVHTVDRLPRVDLVTSYLGADGVLIDAAVAAGARGLVSAGTGAGRATRAEDDALDRARDGGVVICQASRVGSGRVARSPLMRQRGMVAAGDLPPWKARILLALCLTHTTDPDVIQHLFDTC